MKSVMSCEHRINEVNEVTLVTMVSTVTSSCVLEVNFIHMLLSYLNRVVLAF